MAERALVEFAPELAGLSLRDQRNLSRGVRRTGRSREEWWSRARYAFAALLDLLPKGEAAAAWLKARHSEKGLTGWLRSAGLLLAATCKAKHGGGTAWNSYLAAAVLGVSADTVQRGTRKLVELGYCFRVDLPHPDQDELSHDDIELLREPGSRYVLTPEGLSVRETINALLLAPSSRLACARVGCHRRARSRSDFCSTSCKDKVRNGTSSRTEEPRFFNASRGFAASTHSGASAGRPSLKKSSSSSSPPRHSRADADAAGDGVAAGKSASWTASSVGIVPPSVHPRGVNAGRGIWIVPAGHHGIGRKEVLQRRMDLELVALPNLPSLVAKNITAWRERARNEGRSLRRLRGAVSLLRRVGGRINRGLRVSINKGPVTGLRLAEDVQMITRPIRRGVGPGPGLVFVSVDGDSMHARVAGRLSQDEAFLAVLDKGGYCSLAQLLVPGAELPRKVAKNDVVLPWINGSTPAQLLYRLRAVKGLSQLPSLEALEEGDKEFRARFSKLSSWIAGLERAVEQHGRVVVGLPSGTVIEVALQLGRETHTITSAVLLTVETLIIAPAERSLQYPCLDMHDRFIVAVPARLADHADDEVARSLWDSAQREGFDIPVKVGVGDSWGEAEEIAELWRP